MNKSLCFSKEEFSAICSAYQIRQLVCFQQSSLADGEEETLLDRYHQTLFQLYQKEYIRMTEDGFAVTEEVKTVFSLLKECNKVITTFCTNESIPGYCIYLSEASEVILMREGSRKGEYVKIEVLPKKELPEFIKQSGILLSETLWGDFLEVRTEHEIVGDELVTFLKTGSLEKAENVIKIPQLISLCRIQEPTSGKGISYIALIKQPIQDKIIFINEEGIEIFAYSEKKVMELFQRIWEEKNDIS